MPRRMRDDKGKGAAVLVAPIGVHHSATESPQVLLPLKGSLLMNRLQKIIRGSRAVVQLHGPSIALVAVVATVSVTEGFL